MKNVIIIIFYTRHILYPEQLREVVSELCNGFAVRSGVCYPLVFSVRSYGPLSISERVSDLNLSVMSVCVCVCVCVQGSQWSDSSLTLHRKTTLQVSQLQLFSFFFFLLRLMACMFVRGENT